MTTPMTRNGTDDRASADEALAAAARAGDDAAFGELWRRHAAAGAVAARQFAHIADADDLLSEAYVRILAALRRGGGPHGAFRPYLYRTIRNLALDWRRPPEVPIEDAPDADTMVPGPELATAERTLGFRAFRNLPDRWQSVLWYLDVEGLAPADAAPLLGLSPNATSALAVRAREGLKKEWLQAHVNEAAVPEGCRWTTERMGDYARGTLTRRRRERFERHLETCERCSALLEEVEDASGRLAVLLLPLFLGGSAAAALLAGRDTGSSPSAAEPSVIASAGSAVARGVGPRLALAVGGAVAAVAVVAGIAVAVSLQPSETQVAGPPRETPSSEPTRPPSTPTPTPTPTATEEVPEATPPAPSRPSRPVTPPVTPGEPTTPPPTAPAPPSNPDDVFDPHTGQIAATGTGDVPGATIELWGTTVPFADEPVPPPTLLASTVVGPDGTWLTPVARGLTPLNITVTVRQVRDGLASSSVELITNAIFYVGAESREAVVTGSSAAWRLLGWPGAAWEIREHDGGPVVASGVFPDDGAADVTVTLPGGASGTVYEYDFGYVRDGSIAHSLPPLTAVVP